MERTTFLHAPFVSMAAAMKHAAGSKNVGQVSTSQNRYLGERLQQGDWKSAA